MADTGTVVIAFAVAVTFVALAETVARVVRVAVLRWSVRDTWCSTYLFEEWAVVCHLEI